MRGGRIIIGALAWVILAAQSPDKGAAGHQAESAQNVAASANQAEPAIKDANQSAIYEAACEKGEDERRSDLCAQWKAADAANSSARAAWWMAWVAAIGTLIAGLTLIAVIAAAKYAREAAEHTKTGADEARRAADIAAETHAIAVQLERARLVAEPREVQPYAGNIFALMVTVTNVGRSPAVLVECQFTVNAGCDFPGEFKAKTRIEHTMQPGEVRTSSLAFFNVGEVGDGSVYVGGRIIYRTAFGSSHHTHFLTRVDRLKDTDEIRYTSPAFGLSDFYCDEANRKRFDWPEDT